MLAKSDISQMNKYAALVLLLGFFSCLASAQIISVKHYNKNWQITTGDDKYYKREIYKEHDSLYVIRDYYLNDTLEMLGHYSSLDKRTKHGLFVFYYGNGNKHYEGNYCNGVICGDWIEYNERGKEINRYNYDFEIPDCQPFDTSLNSYLKKDSLDYIIVDYLPRFLHKKYDGFEDYIYTNLFIPPLVNKYKIRDNVEVQFTIDVDGNLCGVEVLSHSNGMTIIKEVYRVLINSPQWKPAYSNDIPVQMNFKMPITIN